MNTVIKHIEYQIESLSHALIQADRENKDFKKDFEGIVECGNYEIVSKDVIQTYLSDIQEYSEALKILKEKCSEGGNYDEPSDNYDYDRYY